MQTRSLQNNNNSQPHKLWNEEGRKNAGCLCACVRRRIVVVFRIRLPPPQLSVGSKFYTQHKVNSWIFLVIFFSGLPLSLKTHVLSLSIMLLFILLITAEHGVWTNERTTPSLLFKLFFFGVCVCVTMTHEKQRCLTGLLLGWLCRQGKNGK